MALHHETMMTSEDKTFLKPMVKPCSSDSERHLPFGNKSWDKTVNLPILYTFILRTCGNLHRFWLKNILYAVNPAKITLAEAPFPNAGKLFFGKDIRKMAADNADTVRNLQETFKPATPTNALAIQTTVEKISSKKRKILSGCRHRNLFFHQTKNKFQGQQQPFLGRQSNGSR